MAPLLVILIIGGYVLYAGCFVIGVMAVYEFFKGFKAMDIHASFPIAVCAAIALYIIGIMQDYGAVNAANLDGGSSSSMYYNGQYEMTSVTLYYSTSSWRLPTAFVVTK